MASIEVPSHPPPPPPKRMSRPKITLQIPDATSPTTPRSPVGSPFNFGPSKYRGRAPMTAVSHVSDPQHPYFNPFMYHNKASEFMFKQFEGFKDFTMNTAKSGMSAGEKSAFWFVNKLKILSKKWFTHFFLTICLVLYSVIGAAVFMALEGTNEIIEHDKYERNITEVRLRAAVKLQHVITKELQSINLGSTDLLSYIVSSLEQYETNYTDYLSNVNKSKQTWTFWNSMFYAGTIFTTIDVYVVPDIVKKFVIENDSGELQFLENTVMSEEGNGNIKRLTLQIPIIKAESETQTSGQLVSKTPPATTIEDEMDSEQRQTMSIRKRRNLSKNRGQAARQREKTPEPSRTPVSYEDTTTSDDEEVKPHRNSREIEAEKTYLEMKKMVQERAQVKDPVYDLDTDEILEARAVAATERRRRSISPFAIPDKEQLCQLERKGSFIDPTNKLLTTNYTLSPKDDDNSRRNSLTIEPPREKRNSLSPSTPTSSSPVEKGFPYPLPTTPKKLEEIKNSDEKKPEEKNLKTPVRKEEVFTFEEKDIKQIAKPVPKTPETPALQGELVTKVIQVERTPSKKLTPDKKPNVEVRERIVRTPSRKLSTDTKPVIVKQQPVKQLKDEPQSKVPPVKPARSKSASRFGSKTSESEMSEDQANQINVNDLTSRRKVVPTTPRRFIKNRSPRANRSQSVNRAGDTKVIDKTGTGMSQTSKEIIELMQKARARSLSIPKDDPRLPSEYKNHSKNLKTPNKTPSTTPRNVRGISCPKTIQIISDKVILSGLNTNQRVELHQDKRSRHSSGYVDASQSEYTSSCYSSSPSENEYEFDLSERTAELTRKLKMLSQEVESDDLKNNIILSKDYTVVETSSNYKHVLRKRSLINAKNDVQKQSKETSESNDKNTNGAYKDEKEKPIVKSRWKIILCWQEFKLEYKADYEKIRLLRNRCICDLLLLIILCGLGGMMFKTFEGSFENAYKCGSRSVKRDFIEALWRGSHYLREDDWKSMARNKLHEFENQLHTAFEAGVTSYSGQRSWNFMNSFVYCFTVITTIGYGHIAPKTTYGRAATIIYAVIGIPLFLIVLADFGKLFTRYIKFFWAFIRRFYYTRSCRKVRRTVPMQEVMKGLNIVYDVVRRPSQIFNEEDIEGKGSNLPPPVLRVPSDLPPPLPPKPGTPFLKDPENETEPETPAPSVFEIDDEFNLPISVAIVILIIYILIGAIIYNTWENWSFFESFYFVFISMSTIGLGDLVPDHPHRMMASIMYLVFGLALTSMCINVVQVKLNDTFKHASAKLGATIGLRVADEDGSLVPITPPPTEIVPVHKSKTEIEESKAKEVDENESNNKNR